MLLRYMVMAAVAAIMATRSSSTQVENGNTSTPASKSTDIRISTNDKDSPDSKGSLSKDTKDSEVTGRLIFFDVNNIVNNMLRAVIFYTTGNASIIAPFNNIALETPVIGLILLWLILLAIFVEYNHGTFDDFTAARSVDSHHYKSRILQDVLESLTRALQKHDLQSKS